LGLIVILAVGIPAIGSLRHDVTAAKADVAAEKRLADEAAAKLRDDFRKADLPTKLQHVKDLDRAADDAFSKWDKGTVKFGVLDKAMNDCNDAVDDYNRAAAPFPATMLGDLPSKINLANPETDCGRAFTNNI
jgi:hypothetical protein